MYNKYLKRIIDVLLSLVGLILFIPFLSLIAFCVKVDSKGPLLFTQKRIGKDKKHFYIYKFRTMYIDTPSEIPTHKLQTPDKYITRVGRILRLTSLDELPQLWNIVKGDMSIIGPRPALWNQTDLVEERDKYGANNIRPGLTGWAQINGRDELSIARKAKMDGEYVFRLSFAFDVRCFIGTIFYIFRHEGVVEGNTGISKEQGEEDKEAK